MFWNFIRWGGTIIIILLVLASAFLGKQTEPGTLAPAEGNIVAPAEPAEAAPPPKNFNL